MLATVEQFNIRYGIQGDEDATAIAAILRSVSAQLSAAAGRVRGLELVARVQILSIMERTTILRLDTWPIIEVTEVLQNLSSDWSEGEATEITDDCYRIDSENGELQAVSFGWMRGVNTIRVTYSGGYTAGLADFVAGGKYSEGDKVLYLGQVWKANEDIAVADDLPEAGDTAEEGWLCLPDEVPLPDDIAEAALLQAGFVWQRRDHLGQSGSSAQGGSVSAYGQDTLLPIVRETMQRYARVIG